MEDNIYIVYCHISPSNKRYFGITSVDVNNRWRNGKGYKNNKAFNAAIKKYGWDAFEHQILFENVSREFAIEKEIELIAKYNTTDKKCGYNRDLGGFVHSQSTKQKIGNAHSGDKNYWHNHKHTKDYCENMSKKLKGRVFTEIHRKNLAEAQTGDKNAMYGVKWSQEKRIERSQMYTGANNPNYGNKWTQEQKDKASKRFKGVYRSKYTDKARERMNGGTNPMAKKVICNDVLYETVKECAKTIGVSVTTISPYLAGSRKMPLKYEKMGLRYA